LRSFLTLYLARRQKIFFVRPSSNSSLRNSFKNTLLYGFFFAVATTKH
jgi:hypothetical protein